MAEAEVKTESIGYPMPGDVLDGRYRLDEIINAGGMGVIMRARQLTMDRDVAVKLLLPDRSSRETTRTRFMREIHLAKQLTHPNTIRLYDYGKHGEFLYLVMELLKGRDLKAVLKDEGPLPISRALDILIQAADAVSEAHGRNIVHRDLKPGNLFVQRLGSNRDFVKVLDFGIAKSLESGKYDVTSTGEVSGTVAYLSPEMVRGKKPDKRADVYALGVLFMEMITCRKIFEGATVAETLMNQMQKPPMIPASIANTPLAIVLERALTKEPDARYQDAAELLVALNSVVDSVSPSLRLTEREIVATYGAALDEEDESQNAVEAVEEPQPTSRATRIGYAMALEESETVQVNTDEELAQLPVRESEEAESRPRLGLWIAGIAAVLVIVGVVSTVITPRENPREEQPDAPEAAVAEVAAEPDLGMAKMEIDLGQVDELAELPVLPARGTIQTALDLATGVAELDAEETAVAKADRADKPDRPDKPRPKPDKPKPDKDDKVEVDLDVFGNLKKDDKPKPDPKPTESPSQLRADAQKAFISGDYAGCISMCKKALAGGETSCHALLANAYRQTGNSKAACRHYKAAGIAHKSCITLQSR